MELRKAKADDAERICEVLVRSIKALCVRDHSGDPVTIEHWLSNKTLDNVLSWIGDANQRVIVAEDEGEIVGIGAAEARGEITLNYVSPEARFHGVSKAVLTQLESYLRELGNERCTLSSTRTAHRFYLAAGYSDAGPPRKWGRLSAQPMEKQL